VAVPVAAHGQSANQNATAEAPHAECNFKRGLHGARLAVSFFGLMFEAVRSAYSSGAVVVIAGT